MPVRTPPPPDFLEAITDHARNAHGLDAVPAAEIGRPRSRSRSVRFVWHDSAEWEDAWFVCRRCPPGFDRYLVDLDAPAPSRRILPLIEAHLKTHGVALGDAEQEIGTRAAPRPDQRVFYTPPSAAAGASINCPDCKQRGLSPVFLTSEPYADARRLAHHLRRTPDLAHRLEGLPSSDQAVIVEAHDRGLLQRYHADDVAAARAALARRGVREPRRLDPRSAALLAVMTSRVAAGEGIDTVILQLEDQSRNEPVAYACQLGEHLPALAHLHDQRITPREFARRTNLALGDAPDAKPTTSRTTLYRIWKLCPPRR